MESGINLTLGGLDDLINKAEKIKEDQKEQKMIKFTEIIRGIAKKYASKWCEYDDLEQDLWVRVLELIEDCGGVDNTDESLVARVCFNKAVDKYRYHRRRYDSKAEYIENTGDIEINEWSNDKSAQDYFEAQRCDKFTKGYDLVLIKEVIDLFEIGSRQRKYAVMKLINYGVIQVEDLDPWDKPLAIIVEADPKDINKDKEEDYIHALGYKSHCPGSWTCIKRQMKLDVIDFLFRED